MRGPTKLHDGIITHHIAGVLCLRAQRADNEAAGHWHKSRVPGEKGIATSFMCKERNEEHRGALEKEGKNRSEQENVGKGKPKASERLE